MGTRNLTIVVKDKKTKVAQYGQWDGYPSGQGQTIADFLKTVHLETFKRQIQELGELTKSDIKKVFKKLDLDYNKEYITLEESDRINNELPALNRDHGAGILALIHNGTVKKVRLEEDFKNDTTFCEYYYIIDLDKETVSMNGGKEYTFDQWQCKGFIDKLQKIEESH